MPMQTPTFPSNYVVLFYPNPLGNGDLEIACRNEHRDLIAVITHPVGGKWTVHPVHSSRKKFRTRKEAQAFVVTLLKDQ